MRLAIKILFLLLFIHLNDCKITAPCNQLDSSCNPVTSLFLEKLIRESRTGLTFSPAGGTYKYDPFVNISSSLSSSVIRYTMDGSEPDCATGTIYTQPAPLIGAKTHTLKAVVCRDGVIEGSKSDTYTVTISPLMAPNLRFWYSADSIGTENGMEVKVWNDYSGNANHLYPGSNSLSNPTLVANALNGRPSVRFNSTQKHFMNTKTMASYTGAKAGTGVLVLKKYSDQSEEVFFSIGMLGNPLNSRNWRGNLLIPSVCSAPTSAASCGGATFTQIPLTDYHAIIFTIDSAGAIQYFFDGIADGNGSLTSPTSFSTANTVFVGTGLNVVNFLDAEILELLFFEQGFDTNGVNTVHCILQSKYGLAVGTSCP